MMRRSGTHDVLRQGGLKPDTGRRRFLAAVAQLPVLLVTAYSGLFHRSVAGQEAGDHGARELDPHGLEVLARFAWLLFPLSGLGAEPYRRAAAGLADAARPPEFTLVRDGIMELDAASGGSFLDLPEAEQLEQLRKIEAGDFFRFVYAGVRTRLFDDREVWALLGYEGSSLEKGGYLNRGLNDIDWL